MSVLRISICLAYLLVTGCLQTRLPEGVIATVNGEPVYLRTVQALLDGSVSGSAPDSLSLQVMKNSYGEALGTLIINTLVRQELVHRQTAVNDKDMTKFIAEIHSDYGQENFSLILEDKSLNEAEWQNLLRDHLSMQRFEKEILLPDVKISLSAVRAYYQDHLEDFRLPETLNVCLAVSEQKEEVEAYRNAFSSAAEKPRHAVAEQCQNILPQNLTPELQKVVNKLAEHACTAVTLQGIGWETLCLRQRLPAGLINIAEAYLLIEQLLLEQEKFVVFRRWLEASLAVADIRVSPHVKESLLTPQRVVTPPTGRQTPLETD